MNKLTGVSLSVDGRAEGPGDQSKESRPAGPNFIQLLSIRARMVDRCSIWSPAGARRAMEEEVQQTMRETMMEEEVRVRCELRGNSVQSWSDQPEIITERGGGGKKRGQQTGHSSSWVETRHWSWWEDLQQNTTQHLWVYKRRGWRRECVTAQQSNNIFHSPLFLSEVSKLAI